MVRKRSSTNSVVANRLDSEMNFLKLCYFGPTRAPQSHASTLARRLILSLVPIAIFGILLPVLAEAQISLVHVTSCGPQSFPSSICTIPATGQGNLLVIGWQIGGGANTATVISDMSDNAGNVYAEAGTSRSVDAYTGSLADIWYAANIVAGATTLTITPNLSVTNGAAVIWEFSGASPAVPVDQSAVLNSQGSSAFPTGASVTTSSPSEVVISLAPVGGNITGISSGNLFVADSTLKGNGWAHLITSFTGAYSAQWLQSPAGTYSSSTASFKAASVSSPCDLDRDGLVNMNDVQLAVNMALGLAPCTANIAGVGVCNIAVVQRVVNATLGGACVGGGGTVPHYVLLTWNASTSANVAGYNVYRGTVSGGALSDKSKLSIGNRNYVHRYWGAGRADLLLRVYGG